MSIKKEVGQATWDSWPVGARMAIERLEPLLAALMLALDIIQRPEVRPYVSLDERDIIRDSANAGIEFTQRSGGKLQ